MFFGSLEAHEGPRIRSQTLVTASKRGGVAAPGCVVAIPGGVAERPDAGYARPLPLRQPRLWRREGGMLKALPWTPRYWRRSPLLLEIANLSVFILLQSRELRAKIEDFRYISSTAWLVWLGTRSDPYIHIWEAWFAALISLAAAFPG